jgi:DNA-binding transcriptional MerR regulator/methylmalonyl-CoA mutase cobalamin-binding subunit
MANAGTFTGSAGRADPARLDALRSAGAATAADRAVFDRLASLVTVLLDVPVSLVTLVDEHRQISLGTAGLREPWVSVGELPLTHSFCQHAVLTGQALVLDDAREDPVLCTNRAIQDLDAVAYLGIPLVTSAGHAIGSFCAIDSRARSWTDHDIRVMTDLASIVIAYVEARPAGPTHTLSGGLNIAAVARRTGVAADTLRKWERRYGILVPRRTSGGQRRYDERDVARVEWLRDRLAEGFRIGAAAALLNPASDGSAEGIDELREALADAARAGDSSALGGLVDQAFTLHPLEVVIEDVVTPALAAVGDGWEHDSAAIGSEHLLSEVVRARLERMLSDGRPGVRGKVVLACAPGERHELGLLALAVLLQADGWLIAYLGADAPVEAALALALRGEADVVCISVTLPEGLERLARELEAHSGDRPVVVAGGPAVTKATRLPARILTGSLGTVVKKLRPS